MNTGRYLQNECLHDADGGSWYYIPAYGSHTHYALSHDDGHHDTATVQGSPKETKVKEADLRCNPRTPVSIMHALSSVSILHA